MHDACMYVHALVQTQERGKWVGWMDTLQHKALDPEAEYTTIIVPTGAQLMPPHCTGSHQSCSAVCLGCFDSWVGGQAAMTGNGS